MSETEKNEYSVEQDVTASLRSSGDPVSLRVLHRELRRYLDLQDVFSPASGPTAEARAADEELAEDEKSKAAFGKITEELNEAIYAIAKLALNQPCQSRSDLIAKVDLCTDLAGYAPFATVPDVLIRLMRSLSSDLNEEETLR